MSQPPEPDILSRTGGRIRQARQENGLNLHELARLTGISASALSLIETGKRDARLGTLDRIARALNLPLSRLFDTAAPTEPDDTGDGYDLSAFE